MPLTTEQEALDFSLKVKLMQTEIVLKTEQTAEVKQDRQFDPVRLAVSCFVAGGALVGGIVGLLGYLHTLNII